MTIHFDERSLISTLQSLAPLLRAAFAASCAERHMPLYENFDRLSGRGASEPLTAAMALLWSDQGDALAITVLKEHLIRVMAALPNEMDESNWPRQQACAEDAAAAVAYALRCRITAEPQEAAWAARRCYELADRVAVHLLSGESMEYPAETAVLSHPRVQQELRLQSEALDHVRAADDEVSALRLLREWSIRNRYGSDDC
jgi:hypothetical protein